MKESMETLWLDLRYSARGFLKRPRSAFIIVLTLALGIGANTAVFSFVNALLLRPLPYRDADRLVRIASLRGKEEGRLSMLELKDLREQTPILESVAAPFYVIYGVAPQGFNFPGAVQLFRSIAINERLPNYKDRDARNVYAVARLKPGVSYEQARAELNAFSRRMAETYPNINAGLSFTLKPLRDFYVGDVKPYLWLLLAAVGFVLLIACANVINLLLARSLAREREIAIRTALGAGRLRLIRQLLTESLLLAVVGGLVGLAFAWGWIRLLRSLVRAEMPVWIVINIDWRVLAFTMAVSILTGLIAGLAPALQASKPDLNELLKEGAKGSQGAARRQLRKALVVAQVHHCADA
jgi:putative ABC transport system permease protein